MKTTIKVEPNCVREVANSLFVSWRNPRGDWSNTWLLPTDVEESPFYDGMVSIKTAVSYALTKMEDDGFVSTSEPVFNWETGEFEVELEELPANYWKDRAKALEAELKALKEENR